MRSGSACVLSTLPGKAIIRLFREKWQSNRVRENNEKRWFFHCVSGAQISFALAVISDSKELLIGVKMAVFGMDDQSAMIGNFASRTLYLAYLSRT